ncbi:MAG: FAD-binding oxidoreductase [Chloroflexi bacterium]|nr:FAD-binding oxidoreductase [Chloroflexota bacterium]
MPVQLDVLIIGGGAQGLWLLRHLNAKKFKTLLLEKGELGGGQTCHSHGLIHRGHYYRDVDMLVDLNAAASFWESLLGTTGLRKLNNRPAIAGFGQVGRAVVSHHMNLWEQAGLIFEEKDEDEFPGVLAGGRVKTIFATREFSLNTKDVVEKLSGDLRHLIYRLDQRQRNPRIHVNDGAVTRVDAVIGRRRVELDPQVVVMCAGAGNKDLLDELDLGMQLGEPVQVRRKNHMLLVKGQLPELTAVFPEPGMLLGLFICTRSTANEKVWLVSDHRGSGDIDFEEDPDPDPSGEWIQVIVDSLHDLAPGLSRLRLQWSVYTGLTSERNFGGRKHQDDYFIESFGLRNALVIWPTKLTLTPLASQVAVRIVRTLIDTPAGRNLSGYRGIVRQQPAVAKETWEMRPFRNATAVKTKWMSGPEFQKTYGKFDIMLK